MATKLDKSIIDAAKTENRDFIKKNGIDQQGENKSLENEINAAGSTDQETPLMNASAPEVSETPVIEQKSEFQEKFETYFKDKKLIAGSAAVNMVDDLKCNLLMIHAKKNGVDLPKESFKLDPETREFCAFLIDHGMKNNLVKYVEKYPIASGLALIGINAGSLILMINAMGSSKKEQEKQKRENEVLKAKLAEMAEQMAKNTIDPPAIDPEVLPN